MKFFGITSLIYAAIGLGCGVFYREFTKFFDFTKNTVLSGVHTHYFALGMLFFILLLILDKLFSFATKKSRWIFIVYHIGLNLTCALLIARGIVETIGVELSNGINSMISGIAGAGHIILAIGIILILVQIIRHLSKDKKADIEPKSTNTTSISNEN